jgi:hypothetical protein
VVERGGESDELHSTDGGVEKRGKEERHIHTHAGILQYKNKKVI